MLQYIDGRGLQGREHKDFWQAALEKLFDLLSWVAVWELNVCFGLLGIRDP